MSTNTFISAGSNTSIVATSGHLYGIHVDDANGGVVLVADSVTGLGAAPNFNAVNQTGLIERIGPFQNAGPQDRSFHGLQFYNGLTVAATSNAKVSVIWGT